MYTIRELLRRSGSIRITVFEQRDQIGGLLRTAVARDHGPLRNLLRQFEVPFDDPRVDTRLGIRVGTDVEIAALRSTFSPRRMLPCRPVPPHRCSPARRWRSWVAATWHSMLSKALPGDKSSVLAVFRSGASK